MNWMILRKYLVFFAHPLLGWALCGAIMGIGRAATSLDNALAIHAIAAPIIFAILTLSYLHWFNYTPPLQTAIVSVAVVVGMDAFVVAPFMEKSYAMFTSLLGTWIPFVLIFLSTYLTALASTRLGWARATGNLSAGTP